MSGRWFRFYASAMRNPKVARLTDKEFRLWVELLGVAAENDGSIPCLDDLKHLLKRRLDHLSTGVERLLSIGLIDALEVGYEPHHWSKFQYKSDVSTGRVHKYRAKRNVSETPPDTDTDTEKIETNVSIQNARVKSNPFPKPDWADQQVWDDWMLVRKTRRGRNTATAYAGFLTDIASLTNEEWPPGRLLQYAVTKSWAAIYAPKEGYPSGQSSIRAENDFTGIRGARPNPALDMVLQAERELQAEAKLEDSQPDRPPRLALPPGERGRLEFAPGDAWTARGRPGAH